MVDVTYVQQAEVEDGPTIQNTAKLTTPTGTGFVDVTVAAGASRVVEVQPGDSGDVVLFFMFADDYDTLSYTVDGGGSKTFDGPLLLVGAGCVKLLGSTCNEITFTNGSAGNIRIRILTARVADEAPA